MVLGHPLGLGCRAHATINTVDPGQLELAILRMGPISRAAGCFWIRLILKPFLFLPSPLPRPLHKPLDQRES